MYRPFLIAVLSLWIAAPTPAAAQDPARFTISINGIKAATLTLEARREGSTYSVTGRAASGGLAGMFRSFSLVSTASGSESRGRFRPDSYATKNDGGRVGRSAELVFEQGVPRVISVATDPDPTAPQVDPSTLTGAVDPLTALYAVLRDTPADAACQLDLTLFDGHRVSRVTLSGARKVEGGLECTGVYRRIAGYPPKERARRPRFDFTVRYMPQGNVLQAQELEMNSLFGPARVTRD